jgi:hypothetical protein
MAPPLTDESLTSPLKNAKMTRVYEHELPNMPGKGMMVCSSNTAGAAGMF